jgi:hypothetical protein
MQVVKETQASYAYHRENTREIDLRELRTNDKKVVTTVSTDYSRS